MDGLGEHASFAGKEDATSGDVEFAIWFNIKHGGVGYIRRSRTYKRRRNSDTLP